MFALALDGFDTAIGRLDGLPAGFGAALAAKAAEVATALADRVRTVKLSGGVLDLRSGALRDSIAADVTVDADGVYAMVGSNGDVKYAAIQEFGCKTAAHEILPVKAQALAFMAGGARRFAHKIGHPGSVIPERSYLRSTLDEMSDDIVTALADAAAESLERA